VTEGLREGHDAALAELRFADSVRRAAERRSQLAAESARAAGASWREVGEAVEGSPHRARSTGSAPRRRRVDRKPRRPNGCRRNAASLLGKSPADPLVRRRSILTSTRHRYRPPTATATADHRSTNGRPAGLHRRRDRGERREHHHIGKVATGLVVEDPATRDELHGTRAVRSVDPLGRKRLLRELLHRVHRELGGVTIGQIHVDPVSGSERPELEDTPGPGSCRRAREGLRTPADPVWAPGRTTWLRGAGRHLHGPVSVQSESPDRDVHPECGDPEPHRDRSTRGQRPGNGRRFLTRPQRAR